MKRIELVIDPVALDRFTEAAKELDVSDFDVTEVRRTLPASIRQRQRLYRGHEFVLDLVDRLVSLRFQALRRCPPRTDCASRTMDRTRDSERCGYANRPITARRRDRS